MSFWSKESILSFISIYKSHECLWKVKSKSYSNRILRDRAYDQLVQFVQQFDKTSNIETIKKKINGLRTTFRRELRKMENSKVPGDDDEDLPVYVPQLWYFNEMLFLKDQESPQYTRSTPSIRLGRDYNSTQTGADRSEDETGDTDVEGQGFEYDDENMEETSQDRKFLVSMPFSTSGGASHRDAGGAVTPPVRGDPARRSIHRELVSLKRKAPPSENDMLASSPLSEKLNPPSSAQHYTKDNFDIFGQTVANDLRSMSREQYIHAKKLISDVLYEGQLGALSRSSSVWSPPARSSASVVQPGASNIGNSSSSNFDGGAHDLPSVPVAIYRASNSSRHSEDGPPQPR